MQELHEYFRLTYYTGAIPAVVALIGFFILSLIKKKSLHLNLYRWYFLIYVICTLICCFYVAVPDYNKTLHVLSFKITAYADYILTYLEFFVFALYLKPYLARKVFDLCSLLFTFISIALLVGLLRSDWPIDYQRLFTIQAVALLIICSSYYINIMRSKKQNIANEPHFWIATALSVSMVCSLPYSLMIGYLYANHIELYIRLATIYFFFYTILFITIIIAFYKSRRIVTVNIERKEERDLTAGPGYQA